MIKNIILDTSFEISVNAADDLELTPNAILNIVNINYLIISNSKFYEN